MTRKAKVEVKVDKRLDTQELRQQAAALGAILSQQADEATRNAALLAEQGRDWATPHVAAAKAWAGPRADKLWRDTVKAGAPKVEAAAERVRPAVDNARDRIVDDYLPRVSRAMHDAAEAAAKDGTVRGKASRAGRAAQKAMMEQPKKQHTGLKTVGWVLVGTAAAGTGYLLWRRSQPVDDPWAEEYWDDTTVTAPGAETVDDTSASTAKNSVGTTGTTEREAGPSETAAEATETSGDQGNGTGGRRAGER
ncbi:hypothetical protein PU560_12140 [Georgenia sp. 10Sc9-8]|uniref:DUF3618 domain-containing protein n=1 Tax=Georgenia halotolerans TaxID=3028317 RepID=A0ABT5TYY6_9MICO|nr:hypothetical protein [Georgenia halotolerans]